MTSGVGVSVWRRAVALARACLPKLSEKSFDGEGDETPAPRAPRRGDGAVPAAAAAVGGAAESSREDPDGGAPPPAAPLASLGAAAGLVGLAG